MASTVLQAEAVSVGARDLWPRYRDNLARHLIGISRDFQSRLLQLLGEEHGFEGLSLGFGPFLALIWREGRPLSEIAHALGISGQAASQLAKRIEDAGYLARARNPQDRRSKQMTLTSRGRALVGQGIRGVRDIETEYASLTGATAYRKLATGLRELHRGLDIDAGRDPVLLARADRSIAALTVIAEHIQRELMEAAKVRGHQGLKMSYGQVLPLIGPEGGRIHEIARVQRVSRQAISTTTRELEDLGYLQREPDPRDRRGVVLTFTPAGVALIRDSVAALDDLDRALLGVLGEKRLADLRRVARDLYHALRLEAEVFEPGARSPAASSSTPADRARRSRREIEELAERLWRRLGADDAARLTAALEQQTRREAT